MRLICGLEVDSRVEVSDQVHLKQMLYALHTTLLNELKQNCRVCVCVWKEGSED